MAMAVTAALLACSPLPIAGVGAVVLGDELDVGGQVRVAVDEAGDGAADLGEQARGVEGVHAAGAVPVARDAEVLDQLAQEEEVPQLEGGDVRRRRVHGRLAVAAVLGWGQESPFAFAGIISEQN